MTAKKLFIVEERMLKLLYYVKRNSIKGVSSQKEFCDIIGLHTASVTEIKKGNRGFTTEQILRAASHFDADLYYLFGKTENMFLTSKANVSPLDLLKEAVANIEATYPTKSNAGEGYRKKVTSVK
ncbi:MAG: hypothetical protein WC756_11970 [Taibaiella sp.]|jgi:hypothetical protein